MDILGSEPEIATRKDLPVAGTAVAVVDDHVVAAALEHRGQVAGVFEFKAFDDDLCAGPGLLCVVLPEKPFVKCLTMPRVMSPMGLIHIVTIHDQNLFL